MSEADNVRTVESIVKASIAVKEQLLRSETTLAQIASASETLIASLKAGNKLMLFGNGGSAADSQHIAAEFVGRFGFDRPALPALALSVNTSCLTAIGNDYGFELVFSRQIEALGRKGDVAIGITTSGNSPNVVRGLEAASKLGIRTIAFSGRKGGKVKDVAECCICAPSTETPRIQECHILIGHIISEIAEKALFHEKSRAAGS
jgi:D-sedoheptulose 7-phosphate isomerase